MVLLSVTMIYLDNKSHVTVIHNRTKMKMTPYKFAVRSLRLAAGS
jgi:hypothetical protein